VKTVPTQNPCGTKQKRYECQTDKECLGNTKGCRILHESRGKAAICTPKKAKRGGGPAVMAPCIINLSTTQHCWPLQVPAILPPGKQHHELNMRLRKPQSQPGHYVGQKNLLLLPVIETHYFHHPACRLVPIKKGKCFHYRLGVAQRVGRGIALLFHDRSTRRG